MHKPKQNIIQLVHSPPPYNTTITTMEGVGLVLSDERFTNSIINIKNV